MTFCQRCCLLLLGLALFSFSAHARIVKLVITRTEPYADGKPLGTVGAYERVFGQAYGEVDPKLPQNAIIQDILLAPKNARGMVEYISDFVMLRPTDIRKSNGFLFLSLPNRGNVFGADTTLLKRGYTYLWCAWQGDVLAGESSPGNKRLTMQVPVATENGREITGKLRVELQVVTPTKTLNLSSGAFSGMIHHSYETVSLDNTGLMLTKRVHESDARITVPNSDWAFADCTALPFPGKPSTTQISLKDGFDPNYIYELVYTAKNPLVLGLGFASIRDFASLLRRETTAEVDGLNELRKAPIRATVMQGVSQCSNFIRTFLQLGFNQDENGRQVFDGVNAHIGPRRISLNVRFGRPGGGGMQHEDHQFPGIEAPFTWDTTTDPVSGVTGGILEACTQTGTCPKIMQTLSSTEYRQSRASLTTTDVYGKRDLTIPDNVRIYLFAGTQHSPYSAVDQASGFTTDYNPTQPAHRALLIALEEWILAGKQPPLSVYPTLAAQTLVAPDQKSIGWPTIPGVTYNGRINEISVLDYGPAYQPKYMTGILLQEPPKVIKSNAYTVLVPKVDADGNEVSGIRNTTTRVPLGTYTGWSLRRSGYGEGDLASLAGMFIRFKTTKAERMAVADPRLSLEERYSTHEVYVTAVRKAADELMKEGFLLPEDAQAEVEKADKSDVLKK